MARSRAALAAALLLLWRPEVALCLRYDWMGLDFWNRTVVRTALEWDWGHTWSGVQVNQQPVSRVLSSMLGSYKYTLPRVQLQRGTVYTGASSRLRRLVREMMLPQEKKSFKVAVLGGSVSWGQWVSVRGETDWFSRFTKWMITSFPRANITARNGCTPGVPTGYMIMCLELSLDADVDLVFMEYTLNDGIDTMLVGNRVVMDTERLVRRILALPNKPAVVMLHVPTFGMAGYPRDHPKNVNGSDFYQEFYRTTEDAQCALAQYYDVQYLSLRTALYRLAVHKQQEGFLWEDAFVDHHPGDHGHKIMADLAVNLLQRTAIGLLMEPLSQADVEAATEPLPAPMYAGNVPPSSTMCSVGDAFRALVVLADGFEHVNEGTALKPKFGYVATKPGSRLHIRVDTDRSGVADGGSGQQVSVYVHHLRSYEHMGSANVSCVSGCQCNASFVEAHGVERWSQVYLARMVVTQSRECVIQVQVTDQTKSGEHKFKVSGVVVAERAGGEPTPLDIITGGTRPFGVLQHLGDEVQVTRTKEGRKGGAGWDKVQ